MGSMYDDIVYRTPLTQKQLTKQVWNNVIQDSQQDVTNEICSLIGVTIELRNHIDSQEREILRAIKYLQGNCVNEAIKVLEFIYNMEK